jgi:hypothetical protein
MRRDRERRLWRLEMASSGSGAIEVWFNQDDGTLCGPSGERITREAFFRLRPPGRPGLVIFCAVEARL